MKYILADKSKCVELGIKISGHITKDDKVVLNEKEIMFSPVLTTGSIEDKAVLLGGKVFNTSAELLNIIYN